MWVNTFLFIAQNTNSLLIKKEISPVPIVMKACCVISLPVNKWVCDQEVLKRVVFSDANRAMTTILAQFCLACGSTRG